MFQPKSIEMELIDPKSSKPELFKWHHSHPNTFEWKGRTFTFHMIKEVKHGLSLQK